MGVWPPFIPVPPLGFKPSALSFYVPCLAYLPALATLATEVLGTGANGALLSGSQSGICKSQWPASTI